MFSQIDAPAASDGSPGNEADSSAKIDEIKSTVTELLTQEIAKMKELMTFISSAVELIYGIVTRIAMSSETTGCPSSFLGKYSSLIKILDVLFTLDNMKDMRGGMQIDFTGYKKLIESDSTRNNSKIQKEMMEIQSFLGGSGNNKSSKNTALLRIRDHLRPIRGYERVFTDVLDLIISNLENNVYVTCDEKFGKIRLIPHIMVIIDGAADDLKSINVFTNKKLNLPGIQKLLKSYPILPLYGDMTLTLHHILQLAPHYNKLLIAGTFGFDYADGGKNCEIESHPDYNIRTNWSQIRLNYSKYIAQYQLFINQLMRSKHYDTPIDVISTSSYGQHVLNTAENATELCVQGLALLSQWKTYVLLMMAWKYTHPNTKKVYVSRSTDNKTENESLMVKNTEGLEYEQAILRNFNEEELYILSDIISLIKSLASQLYRNDVYLSPLFRMHQHHRLQQLMKSDMLPVLRRVYKRKDTSQLNNLLQIVQLVGDNPSTDIKDDETDYKSYSRKQGSVIVNHKIRVTEISSSRLCLLRSKIHEVYHEKSLHRLKHGLLGKTDLEKDDIASLEIFYNESYYYNYLLNFHTTVREVSSLGEVWFREHHLDLTKCVEFPIEMSLIRMLTDQISNCNNYNNDKNTVKRYENDEDQDNEDSHIFSKNIDNLPIIESIFHILDIYNDVANQAKNILKEQHLYNEIEAECSSVLANSLNSLCDNIYSYTKDSCAVQILEEKVKNKLEDIKTENFLTMRLQKFKSIATQKNIKILGKTINFNEILKEKVTKNINRDIGTAIKKFEQSDLCSIIELQNLLDIIRCTHKELSNLFDLDDYLVLFKTINESLPDGQNGRIAQHILSELEADIIPNYSYNTYTNRFVKACVMNSPNPGMTPKKSPQSGVSEKAPVEAYEISNAYGSLCCKIFETHGKMGKEFFGLSHIESLICLLQIDSIDGSVYTIIEKCMSLVTFKLNDAHDYIGALKDGIPFCKSPSFAGHVAGCIDYYETKLSSLLEFEDLKPELFQVFREIGNIIYFLKSTSDVLDTFITVFDSSKDENRKNSISPYNHLLNSTKFPLLGTATSFLITYQNENANCNENTKLGHRNDSVHESKYDENKNENEMSCEKINYKTNESIKFENIGKYSMFQITLKHIEITLQEKNLFKNWKIEADKSGGEQDVGEKKILDPEIPDGFHIMWSALSFLFCLSSASAVSSPSIPSNFTDIEVFGDGFQLCGCVILHYLGERGVFELNDYNHLLLRVHSYEAQAAPSEYMATAAGLLPGSGKGRGSFLGAGTGAVAGAVAAPKRSASVAAVYGTGKQSNKNESLRDTESVIAAAANCHHHQQMVFNMLRAQWNFGDLHTNSKPIGGLKIKLFRPPI